MRIRVLAFALALPVLAAAYGCGSEDENKDKETTAAGDPGSTSGTPGATIHGCTIETAESLTGKADIEIPFVDFKYTPQCVKVSKGTNVKFSGDFKAHPLVGGEFKDGLQMPDDTSPIKATNTGMEATFALPDAGEYPYYCKSHTGLKMYGVIYVE